MKIGVSSCLLGTKCQYNGEDLLSTFLKDLEKIEEIELIPFCPEHSVFGTPRANLRIVGGDGYDVLDGKACVISDQGEDVTEKQILAANRFLDRLTANEVNYAILMDGSPTCGSNIILKDDNWPQGGFRKGVGVSTALLRRNGIIVLSSFDHLSISHFLNAHLESCQLSNDHLEDLKDTENFKELE